MVFINRIKDIIKIFEECSREEIGISLFAYEEFLCKGLKVSDKDLKRLTEIFNYYDEVYSDDYPSLTNEILQESDKLIGEYFFDTNRIKKDNLNLQINYSGRYYDTSLFNVEAYDSTGYPQGEFRFSVSDKTTKSNSGKDSFNATYNACKEVQNELKKRDIKSMLNTFRF